MSPTTAGSVLARRIAAYRDFALQGVRTDGASQLQWGPALALPHHPREMRRAQEAGASADLGGRYPIEQRRGQHAQRDARSRVDELVAERRMSCGKDTVEG